MEGGLNTHPTKTMHQALFRKQHGGHTHTPLPSPEMYYNIIIILMLTGSIHYPVC